MEYKNTKRSGILFVLLSILTINIFCLVRINKVKKEVDYFSNSKSKPFWPIWLLGFLTFYIAPLIYIARLSSRIEEKAKELNIEKPTTSFGLTFNFAFFGILFIFGPFIAFHKFFATLNRVEAILNSNPVVITTLKEEKDIDVDFKDDKDASLSEEFIEKKEFAETKEETKESSPRVFYEDPAKTNINSTKWRVRYASRKDAIKTFDTQEEAIEFAKSLAKTDSSKITVKSSR